MLAELKSKLLWFFGGMFALGMALLALFFQKKPKLPPLRVVPKEVPKDREEMLKEARREGIIK